jgi:DNA-binding protein HU-beta
LRSVSNGEPPAGQGITSKTADYPPDIFFSLLVPPLTNVTKAEVISEISQKTGIEKADVLTTVEAFFKVVKDSMTEGHNIYVRGFGSFVNKKRARKVARNISKNTSLIIDEHYIPSFKPSKTFVAKIKGSKKITGEASDKAPKAAKTAKKAKA